MIEEAPSPPRLKFRLPVASNHRFRRSALLSVREMSADQETGSLATVTCVECGGGLCSLRASA